MNKTDWQATRPRIVMESFSPLPDEATPAFEDFLRMPTGDLLCVTADNFNGLRPLALKVKCDRSLGKFMNSAGNNYALAQHEDVRELLTQLGNLPIHKADESSKSNVAASPESSNIPGALSFQSNRQIVQSDCNANTASTSICRRMTLILCLSCLMGIIAVGFLISN
jgi:hypothetical protein